MHLHVRSRLQLRKLHFVRQTYQLLLLKLKNCIYIRGLERQIVWIGTDIQITSTDQEHMIFWSGDRIDIKIPANIPPGEYPIMVVKGGSSKMAKDKVIITSQSQANTATGPRGVSTQPT
jgi:hypothetical protein